MLMPVLEEVATELGEAVKIVKVNIDENPATPGQYGVRSIPTLALFKDGHAVSTKVGVHPKGSIIDWIKENS
jgi:thioredoxin 1